MKRLLPLLLLAALALPTPAQALSTQDLAERYRPKLLFDSSARWRPVSVDRFLFSGNNFICSTAGVAEKKGDRWAKGCKKLQKASQFGDFWEKSAVLDIDSRGGRKEPSAHLPELSRSKQAIYWQAAAQPGKTFINYWWFLRFNDVLGGRATENASIDSGSGPLFHEADWEGITVAIDNDGPRMLWVGYSAHGKLWRYLPGVARCSKFWDQDGCTHPRVFLANKSNAAYPFACSFSWLRPCKQTTTSGSASFPLLEGGYNGKRLWSGSLLAMHNQSWLYWPGNWNSTSRPRIDSPGPRALFSSPWSEDVCTPRGSSGKCPKSQEQRDCLSFAGPGVSALRCRPTLLNEMAPEAIVQTIGENTKAGDALPFSVAGGDEVWLQTKNQKQHYSIPWNQPTGQAHLSSQGLCLRNLCLLPST